ncbi:hypothetical protein Taro_028596 [Colocasia esculenta]|uniref:DUF7745 domain-containing protein n=1 Tax=Colocasia esculenta TaxID=4460 RepID=A0A843VNL1_COLES|nr:hypothetical protein [Colocasia esculenta]
MKRSFSAFQDDIKPYAGPKVARVSHAELQRLSSVPGHICIRPELQIFLDHRRFSKVPWSAPMIEMLPLTSTQHLREWGLSMVLVLAKQYHKIVHVWDNLTTLAELWHPQTHTFIFPGFEATILLEELELMLGLPMYKRGEEHAFSYTVAPIDSWSILGEITIKKTDLHNMTSQNHVHLLPISQWIVSQCKRKTGNHLAIAKAAAICIYGVILFPAEDGAISFANLSIIDSVSEGTNISSKGSVDTPHTDVDTMLQALSQKMKKWSSSVDTRPSQVDTRGRSQRTMFTGLYSQVDTRCSQVDTRCS